MRCAPTGRAPTRCRAGARSPQAAWLQVSQEQSTHTQLAQLSVQLAHEHTLWLHVAHSHEEQLHVAQLSEQFAHEHTAHSS